MNSKLKNYLGAALLVLLVVGGTKFFLRHSKPAGAPLIEHVGTSPEQTMLSDRDSLKKKDVSDYELVGALIRLAVHHDPGVREELTQRVQSPSKIIRSGVADAIGYYDDAAALKSLETLLTDPEENVRLGAVGGLSHVRNVAREKLIIQHLNGKHADTAERIEGYSALISASSSAEVRTGALKHLFEIAESRKPLSATAAVKMMGLAASDTLTLHMARSAVESGADPQIEADAIRHFAGFDAGWIRPRLDGLKKNPHANVRMAVVQSMHGACPTDRWLILKTMVDVEKDPGVLDALVREAESMPGQGSYDYLNWIRTNYKGKNDNLVAAASLSLVRTKSVKSQDPCENQK